MEQKAETVAKMNWNSCKNKLKQVQKLPETGAKTTLKTTNSKRKKQKYYLKKQKYYLEHDITKR